MTLIQSVSGIRGTIGGASGSNLTPTDAVRFASAYGHWLQQRHPQPNVAVVIGRDARPSGPMISNLVGQTLIGMGIQVIDLGLSTTPTVEMAVPFYAAQGGIILTASHNPVEWNALKLLNEKGEFYRPGKPMSMNPADILFSPGQALGGIQQPEPILWISIVPFLKTPFGECGSHSQGARFRVSVNSAFSGGVAVPKLLERKIEVITASTIHTENQREIPHNPEPLPEHLTTYCSMVKSRSRLCSSPIVDRLAFERS